MTEQLDAAKAERAPDLDALLVGSDTWTVGSLSTTGRRPVVRTAAG